MIYPRSLFCVDMFEIYDYNPCFLFQFLCVLVIILSIAGAAISAFSGDVSVKPETGDLISTLGAGVSIAKNLKTAQDLFICIIIFSVLAILLSLFVKFQKSGDQSKYEVSDHRNAEIHYCNNG